MNGVKQFGSFQFGILRIKELDGAFYFCATDVAEALEFEDPAAALKKHCTGVYKIDNIEDKDGRQKVARFITEDDLWRLIIASNRTDTDEFVELVWGKFLPTMRGDDPEAASSQTPQEIMARAVLIAKQTLGIKEKCIEMQKKRIERMQPAAKLGEALADSADFISITEATRFLARIDPDIKVQAVTGFLRKNKYMCAKTTAPTRKAMDEGYMVQVLSNPAQREDGSYTRVIFGKLTGKGLAMLVKELV